MIHHVTPTIFRGPRPRVAHEFETLRRHGVRSILDLETYALDWRGTERERYLTVAATHGMVTLSLPLGAVLPPSLHRLDVGIRLLRAATPALPTLPAPVYVHCRAGKDRTGMLIAAYRIKVEKTDLESAIDEMLAMGFHKRYLWWIPQLERFSRA